MDGGCQQVVRIGLSLDYRLYVPENLRPCSVQVTLAELSSAQQLIGSKFTPIAELLNNGLSKKNFSESFAPAAGGRI